jgi:hypothetical protein
MRPERRWLVGLAVVLVLAPALASASSASASAPEFGRCLKQATKALSNFDNAKCVKLAGEDAGTEAEKLKKGNYQWFPGVVNAKFTTKIQEGTIVTLESVGGTKITCTQELGTGEYVGTKEVGHVLFELRGCETNKGKCGPSGSGVLKTASLAGTLGYETITEDQPAKDHLALELHAEGGGSVLSFECAGLKVVVNGSILHKIAANAMKLVQTERFIQSRGKQKPEHFAGGVPGEHILEWSVLSQPFEQVGFSMSAIQTNEEKVEASTVN